MKMDCNGGDLGWFWLDVVWEGLYGGLGEWE